MNFKVLNLKRKIILKDRKATETIKILGCKIVHSSLDIVWLGPNAVYFENGNLNCQPLNCSGEYTIIDDSGIKVERQIHCPGKSTKRNNIYNLGKGIIYTEDSGCKQIYKPTLK